MEKKLKAIAHLREVCYSKNLPRNYSGDLLFDVNTILTNDDSPFVWGLRECGTYLILLSEKNFLDIIKGYRIVSEDVNWYLWDGETLKQFANYNSILEMFEGE
jgi:hypothetical protein